jgi:hypothetical protein
MGKVIDRLPESWKTRKTADAVMAPSAILLAGAGAAGAILGGLPLLAILGVGALFYGGRVATLMPRRKGKERIDAMSISDPWRGFTREALDAQRRYRKAVATTSPGPLRDRLVEIGDGIDEGVSECWRIARRGDALVNAIDNLDSIQARKELDAAKRAAKDSPGRAQKETVEALQAQVDSADRLIKVAQDAQNDLRLLNARLDEAVARAVELAIRAEDVGELSGLGDDVEALVSQMESMRQGLEEAAGKAEHDVTGAVAAASGGAAS